MSDLQLKYDMSLQCLLHVSLCIASSVRLSRGALVSTMLALSCHHHDFVSAIHTPPLQLPYAFEVFCG